jgi:hypothetical protein
MWGMARVVKTIARGGGNSGRRPCGLATGALALVGFAGCAEFPDYPLGSWGGGGAGGESNGVGGGEGVGGAPPVTPEVRAWLDAQAGAWCLDAYPESITLCGTSAECVSSPLLTSYPDGFAFDVGFYWDGVDTGVVVAAGGNDVDMASVSVAADGTIRARARADEAFLLSTITPGRHLVSLYVGNGTQALYVDGALRASGSIAQKALVLGNTKGPGFALGRSQNGESTPSADAWLRYAPFFLHLRDRGTPSAWSLADATNAGAESRVYLDAKGVSSGQWSSTAGDGLVVAIEAGIEWTEGYESICFP